MFNRKMLSAFAYVVAGLLVLKALLSLTMFVWSNFETPPIAMFPTEIALHLQYLLLVQELGTILFFYLVVGALKNLCTCSCNVNVADSAKKEMEGPVKPLKRVARKAKK